MTVANVSPIFFESISMVTAAPKAELGTKRVEGGVEYRLVYNCGGSTAATRLGMTRPVSAAAGLYSGSVSSVSGDLCMGFVKHADIPAGEYGWVVTKGLVTVSVASGVSSQDIGPKALGPLGVIATLSGGYACIGELTTAIVSGNTGTLFVAIQ